MKLSSILIGITFLISSCGNNSSSLNKADYTKSMVTALIEIPSESLEKWELNKNTGRIERDSIDKQPRTIDYLGYPANYGMIPGTILTKSNGGDGDPLDVLFLESPMEKGTLIKCNIIGVLQLTDNGERDDKLIAITRNSSINKVKTIEELDLMYNGISQIIEIWFCNYKRNKSTVSLGYESLDKALNILELAQNEYSKANP
tara:strand:+ start:105 stop:710 length:606 start_codon:yes stop_codon:yes gene_type:complete